MKRLAWFAILGWAALAGGCASADREFRTRVESISAEAARSADGASGGVTIHLRDPRPFAK